jgi:hypothetical protein
MKKLWARAEFRMWLAVVGSASLVLGAAYLMVQQSTRLGANDQPIVNLQVAKNKLNFGIDPKDVVPQPMSDLAYDSVPFIMIADNSGSLVTTSALMNGNTPSLPPSGVFDYTIVHGPDRITWQPAENIRLATIVEKYANGYIVSGQSLKEPEKRISTYTAITAASLLFVVVWSSIVLFIKVPKIAKNK